MGKAEQATQLGDIAFSRVDHRPSAGVPVGRHLLDGGDFDASRRSALRRTTGVMIDCERPGARSERGPGVARDEVYDCTTLNGNKIVPYDASGLREPGEIVPYL
jgi:hypothetical protein